MWMKLVPLLSPRFRVIVPDLPGFGESDCPVAPLTTADYVEILGTFLDELGLKKIALAGISYGAELCALVASQSSDLIDRLVLVAGTGFNDSRWVAMNDIRWLVAASVAKRTLLNSTFFLGWYGSRSFHDIRNRPAGFVEHFRRQLSQPGKREAFLQCARNISSVRKGYAEQLQRIAAPTLIAWGENDRVLPARHARRYHESIRRSTLRIFPACGHSVPLEKPDDMCREIGRFASGEERE
jgi:pimeloyl-ACP methyl ester carboxylesterase